MDKHGNTLIESILALRSTDSAFEDFKKRMSSAMGGKTLAFETFVTFATGCTFGTDALRRFATELLLTGIQLSDEAQKVFRCYYACLESSYFATMLFDTDASASSTKERMRAQLIEIVKRGRAS